MRCIENIAKWCDNNEVDGRIEYVFEAGCNHEKDARVILDRVAESAELIVGIDGRNIPSFRRAQPIHGCSRRISMRGNGSAWT
jgi:hypothetical protein